ncbi:polysaccharide polymerase [Lactiplantibacillus plantarum]|nr:polysaccharide polymerase [Lactiplantibacillus plantarum]
MTEASSHAGGNFFKPLLFFAGFYLIYQPNFWTNSYVPMIITLGIAIICVLALSPYEVLLTIDGLKIFELVCCCPSFTLHLGHYLLAMTLVFFKISLLS